MDRGAGALNGPDDEENVVPLGVEKREPPPAPPPPQNRLYRAAITGMSLSAFVGIVVLVISIGIDMGATWRRAVVAVVVSAVVAFLACASIAVFTAARETYPQRSDDATGD